MQLIAKRFLSTADKIHVDPHRFKQFIQLTDGSITYISSLSPPRNILKLNIDSLSHPSWNPSLREKLLLDDHGEVARFRKKYGAGGEDDFSQAAEKFVGETRKLDSQTKSAPPKNRSKKK